MGAGSQRGDRVDFDACVRLEFRGAQISFGQRSPGDAGSVLLDVGVAATQTRTSSPTSKALRPSLRPTAGPSLPPVRARALRPCRRQTHGNGGQPPCRRTQSQ